MSRLLGTLLIIAIAMAGFLILVSVATPKADRAVERGDALMQSKLPDAQAAALRTVQSFRAKDGTTVREYLNSKHGSQEGWSVKSDGDKYLVEFTVHLKGLSSPTVYRWEVSGERVLAANGHAIGVTPDADKVKVEQADRLARLTSEKEREIHSFMRERWQHYERLDGEYLSALHDAKVLAEAASQFAITTKEAEAVFDKVEKVVMGIDPTKVVSMNSESPPVALEITSVRFAEGIFTVTARTNSSVTLPTINLTLDLYKSGQKMGYQVVWLRDLPANGSRTFESLRVRTDFDSFSGTAYINAEELTRANLRSPLATETKPGETVIPVLKLPLRTR